MFFKCFGLSWGQNALFLKSDTNFAYFEVQPNQLLNVFRNWIWSWKFYQIFFGIFGISRCLRIFFFLFFIDFWRFFKVSPESVDRLDSIDRICQVRPKLVLKDSFLFLISSRPILTSCKLFPPFLHSSIILFSFLHLPSPPKTSKILQNPKAPNPFKPYMLNTSFGRPWHQGQGQNEKGRSSCWASCPKSM